MKTKEELNNMYELPDEALEQVEGGINWLKFGQAILANGGGAIPALAELVSAIENGNWPLVAILALRADISSIPIVVKCLNIAK